MSDDTTRTLSFHLEETDLVALLRTSLSPLVAQAAEAGVELRVEVMGGVPPVVVDREKIAWCVATLVGNALRYVRKAGADGHRGGSVLVHVEHDEASPEIVMVSVQDDGPGIPDDKLPYLFERRSGAAYADGLALMLVRDIVRAHGGRIDVESWRGPDEHGTSVTIRLEHGRSGESARSAAPDAHE